MRLLLGFLLLVMASTNTAAQAQTGPAYRAIKGLKVAPGEEMPDFATAKNLKSYRGKPVLINFYSAQCSPCIREIPKLNTLKRLNPELQVLAITPDTAEQAIAYAKERLLAWPIAAPGQEYVFETLGVAAFPTFAIIDADGKLVSATYGNQLGGEDGHATLDGISAWASTVLGQTLK